MMIIGKNKHLQEQEVNIKLDVFELAGEERKECYEIFELFPNSVLYYKKKRKFLTTFPIK